MKAAYIVLALFLLTGISIAEPQIVEFSPAEYSVQNGIISVNVYLKNAGSDMYSDWIIELQPRPTGQLPLAWVSGDQVCDPSYPANVHEGYQLFKGETAKLTINSEPGEGTWDIYILARDKCWTFPPEGNRITTSLGWGSYKKIGTVKIGTAANPSCEKCTSPGTTKAMGCSSLNDEWVTAKVCNADMCWDNTPRYFTWCGDGGICQAGKCSIKCDALITIQYCPQIIAGIPIPGTSNGWPCPVGEDSNGCRQYQCDKCGSGNNQVTTTTLKSSQTTTTLKSGGGTKNASMDTVGAYSLGAIIVVCIIVLTRK